MATLHGKCHCGLNQFTVCADAEFQFICYCTDCRVLSSSGHLCGMIFDKNHFTAADNTQTYTWQGGSGHDIVLHFCPTCSTQLYSYPLAFEDKIVIRPACLPDVDFKPQQLLFPESAFSWDIPHHIEPENNRQ